MLWLSFLVFGALWLYGLNPLQRWRYRHIPGPRPSWLLGNAATIRDRLPPLAYTAWSKQYGPIFKAFLGLQPIVVISDPELVREVGVKQFLTFHDRPMIMVALGSGKRYAATAAGMLQAKGTYWASVRAAAQPLFHSSSLASYAPNMASCAEELAAVLDGAARTGQPLDFHQHAGRLAMDVTGTTVFGVRFNSQVSGKNGAETPLVSAFHALLGSGSVVSIFHVMQALVPAALHYFIGWLAVLWPTAASRRTEAGRTAMFGLSAALVESAWRDLQRRGVPVTAWQQPGWKWFSQQNYAAQGAVPSDDSIISRMLRAKNKATGSGLSDMQVVAQSNGLLVGGAPPVHPSPRYDTTANALSFAVYLLSQHPEVQRKLVAEVDALGSKELTGDDLERLPYTQATFCEVLRMFPPAGMVPRVSSAATKIGGYHLPKGTTVTFNIYGVHHDPKYWPEPEVFRPERFLPGAAEAEGRHPNAFLAFGLGPRMCIAYKFAIQEGVLVLARLYRDFTFRLAFNEPLQLRYGLVFQPKNGLPVYVRRRITKSAAM